MAIGNYVVNLPPEADDGATVVDSFGTIWRYDQQKDSWINEGETTTIPVVTEQRAGLVSPAIFNKLRRLQTSYDSSRDSFLPLKLVPGTDAYWYYFRSADKLIRFTPEGNSALRIEIDRGRLHQILRKQVCPGPKGERGDKGDQGKAGLSGALEGCFAPTGVSETQLDFSIFVPITHTTPISIRIHKVLAQLPAVPGELAGGGSQLSWWSAYLQRNGFTNPQGPIEQQLQQLQAAQQELAMGRARQSTGCQLPLSTPITATIGASPMFEIRLDHSTNQAVLYYSADPAFQLDWDRTSQTLQYDQSSGVVCGSLFLFGSWGKSSSWCVKARQVGPKGDPGPDGTCRIRPIECIIPVDAPLLATCPVVSVRVDCERESVHWMCTNLTLQRCVDQLALSPIVSPIANNNALKATFGAAEVTTAECKAVQRYQLLLPEDDLPDLELMHWDPQPGCVTKRNFQRHNFDWIPLTDVPACNDIGTLWYGADSLNPLIFPWPPVVEKGPEEATCCADPFFYCPNEQEGEKQCPDIPPPLVLTPPPPPGSDFCLEVYITPQKGSGGDAGPEVLLHRIQLAKVTGRYWYLSEAFDPAPREPAWRACILQQVYGANSSSAVCSTQDCVRVDVPIIYELFCKDDRWIGKISYPKCFDYTAIPTSKKEGSQQGSGNWTCDNFTPQLLSSTTTGPVGVYDVTGSGPCDFDNPASIDLAGGSTLHYQGICPIPSTTDLSRIVHYRLHVVSGTCGPSPPPPPPPPPPSPPPVPPPPSSPNCCIPQGAWTLHADGFGGQLALTNQGNSMTGARSLGPSLPFHNCSVPLVNRAVQYIVECMSATTVRLSRIYSCCGEKLVVQQATIPFANPSGVPTGGNVRLDFPLKAVSTPDGLCQLPIETVTIMVACPATAPPPPPVAPPPVAPPAPPPPPGGCGSNEYPCGQILFTGTNNSGSGVASRMVIKDPVGEIQLRPYVANGKTVWRGCTMRTVPVAWSKPTLGGSGGFLVNHATVPVNFDLYCVPYPGNFGRPTPSPNSAYPTTGWFLRMNYPIRAAGETIPAQSYDNSTPSGQLYKCTVGGAGGFTEDWFPPTRAQQIDSTVSSCAARPAFITFTLVGVQDFYGTSTVQVQAIERT